jgi:AhpD family alkylhydroperoxidase
MLIYLALLAEIFTEQLIQHPVGKLIEEFDSLSLKNERQDHGNRQYQHQTLFLHLNTTSYAEGALDVKTKEMLGLVASMVLRCDDCIKYHLGKCHEAGVNQR